MEDQNVKNTTPTGDQNNNNTTNGNIFDELANVANNANPNTDTPGSNNANVTPQTSPDLDIFNQLQSTNQNAQATNSTNTTNPIDDDNLVEEVFGTTKSQPQEPQPILQEKPKKLTSAPENVAITQRKNTEELISRKDFVSYLVLKGYLTSAQAEQYQLEAEQLGKPVEEIIIKKANIPAYQLYKEKAAFYKVRFIEDVFALTIPEQVLTVIKKHVDIVKQTNSFPIGFDNNTRTVKILIANFLNYNAIQFWRITFAAADVEIYTAVPSEIKSFIAEKFGNILDTTLAKEVREIETEIQTKQPTTQDVELTEQKNLESTSGVAKLVDKIINNAARTGASDIHIEPTAKDIRVRYRIDGILHERFSGISRTILSELVARIKILAHLKIDETRLPQDGRIFRIIDNRKFDIRVSTLPTIYGEKIVMRLLERSGHIPKLEELGMSGQAFARYKEALTLQSGIILITGPTGSGKTTTLASSLARINSPDVNIISVEDPVEIRIDGVVQVQVQPEIGLTFANVLRAILRQDPDKIMVGEIRDKETAHLAIRAALTGHLVLSTLHTNDAPTAIPRLIDMGVEPYLVASTVRLVVAQRLVRVLCPYSREAYKPTKTELANILKEFKGLKHFNPYEYIQKRATEKITAQLDSRQYILHPPVKPPFTYEDGTKGLFLYKAKPHPKCHNTEYKGRVGIYEVLKITKEIQDAILKESDASEIKELAQKQGMFDLLQDGYIKALEGITTYEEVLKVAKV